MDIIGQIFASKRAAAVEPSPDEIWQPYRPGSGTEGMSFDEAWCNHCTRDRAYRDGGPQRTSIEGE